MSVFLVFYLLFSWLIISIMTVRLWIDNWIFVSFCTGLRKHKEICLQKIAISTPKTLE